MVEALNEAEGPEEVEGAVDGDRGEARVEGPPALEKLGRRRAVGPRAERLHDRAPCAGVGAAGAGEAGQQPARLAGRREIEKVFQFSRTEHTPAPPGVPGQGGASGSRLDTAFPAADTVDPPCEPAVA